MEERGGGAFRRWTKGFFDSWSTLSQSSPPNIVASRKELVRDMAYSFYLEETLAADDPARLAEWEALRDARD
jgi:hypothetical protein